jgi:heme-degrading monooxygenase HmoA
VMEENFVWMTARRIKPGTLADFKRLWRPERHPEGLLHAYAYWSDDEQELIAVSSWASRESCETWRASWEETHRRAAIAPYVLSEEEGFTMVASCVCRPSRERDPTSWTVRVNRR